MELLSVHVCVGLVINCSCTFSEFRINSYLDTKGCSQSEITTILEALSESYAKNTTHTDIRLIMRGSALATFPSKLKNLPIVTLTFTETNIILLDSLDFQLKKLNNIELRSNRIHYICPGFLSAFPNLVNLDSSHNNLQRWETFFCNNHSLKLLHLETLNLKYNRITQIDNGFFSGFPNLKNLYVAGYDLTFLSINMFLCISTFTRFEKLKDLRFENNKISHIEAGFLTMFPSLIYLHLPSNDLTELNKEIWSTSNNTIEFLQLEHLDFTNNHIWHISEGFFAAFPNLQTLWMFYNHLTQLTANMFLSNGRLVTLEKLIAAYFSNNNISFIEPAVFTTLLPSVTVLHLAFNDLSTLIWKINTRSEIYLKNNHLKDIKFEFGLKEKKDPWFIGHDYLIKHMDFSNNLLQRLPEEMQEIKIYLKSFPATAYLHGNPWYCDCSIRWMKTWIHQNIDSEGRDLIICDGPFFNKGEQMTTLDNSRFICDWTIIGPTSAVLSIAILVFLGVLTYKWRYRWKFWLYNKYGFHPFDKDECENEDKRFDVFLSYSNDESEFARELIDDLAREGFCVCCHELDFQAGTCIGENVERAVHYSKRTLCLVSRAFMQSTFCMQEFLTARSYDFTHRRNRLIMVLYEDVPRHELHEEIRLYMSSFTYLRRDAAFFMARLMYVLPQVRIGDLDDEYRPLLSDPRREGYGADRQVQGV